jgi:hypothetical protein
LGGYIGEALFLISPPFLAGSGFTEGAEAVTVPTLDLLIPKVSGFSDGIKDLVVESTFGTA